MSSCMLAIASPDEMIMLDPHVSSLAACARVCAKLPPSPPHIRPPFRDGHSLQIRDWVLLPIFVVMIMQGLVRQYVNEIIKVLALSPFSLSPSPLPPPALSAPPCPPSRT